MASPIENYIEAPAKTRIQVGLAPVHNVLYSMVLLTDTDRLSGLADWVVETADQLTAEELKQHYYVLIGFHPAIMPKKDWRSFPAFLKHLEKIDPQALQDKIFEVYQQKTLVSGAGEEILPQEALSSEDQYIAYLKQRFSHSSLDEDLERWAYQYIIDPPAMKQLIVSHLGEYWDKYLKVEWERVRPTLQKVVDAYRDIDLDEMGNLEAAKYVLGQTRVDHHLEKQCVKAEGIYFAPSMHAGPYIGKFGLDDYQGIFFGARLPENDHSAPELSQADIYVRLNALADETRLQILKLISTEGESCSTEIINALDLSQSAASRHLTQLTATGYLIARRKDGAKCYQLDKERIGNTLDTIKNYLDV